MARTPPKRQASSDASHATSSGDDMPITPTATHTAKSRRQRQTAASPSEDEDDESDGDQYEDEADAGPRRMRTPHGPELIGLTKVPYQVIPVPLPWQHAVSRNEAKLLSLEQKGMMVQRPVRVMLCARPPCGPDEEGRLRLAPANVWFVAKDIAQLLHIHEANVARRIAAFSPQERARMPVQCVQSNGTKATLMLSVLSVEGTARLLTASKKAVMGTRLNAFLLSYIATLCHSSPYADSLANCVTPSPSPSASTISLHPSSLGPRDPQAAADLQVVYRPQQQQQLIPIPVPAMTAALLASKISGKVTPLNTAFGAASFMSDHAMHRHHRSSSSMSEPASPAVVVDSAPAVLARPVKKQYLEANHMESRAPPRQPPQLHAPPPTPTPRTYQPNQHSTQHPSQHQSQHQHQPPQQQHHHHYHQTPSPFGGSPYPSPHSFPYSMSPAGGSPYPTPPWSYPPPPPMHSMYGPPPGAPYFHSSSAYNAGTYSMMTSSRSMPPSHPLHPLSPSALLQHQPQSSYPYPPRDWHSNGSFPHSASAPTVFRTYLPPSPPHCQSAPVSPTALFAKPLSPTAIFANSSTHPSYLSTSFGSCVSPPLGTAITRNPGSKTNSPTSTITVEPPAPHAPPAIHEHLLPLLAATAGVKRPAPAEEVTQPLPHSQPQHA